MPLNPAHAQRMIRGLFGTPPGSALSDLRLPDRERVEMAARRVNYEAWTYAQHGHEAYSEQLYAQARRIAPSYAVSR